MTSPRVLIVDDEIELTRALRGVIEMLGYETVCAHGAEEALSVLERTRVDLILSDYRMPGGDGIALFEQIRLLHRAPPPFILTSGYGNDALVARANALGIRRILEKPFEVSQLREAIADALRPASGLTL